MRNAWEKRAGEIRKDRKDKKEDERGDEGKEESKTKREDQSRCFVYRGRKRDAYKT